MNKLVQKARDNLATTLLVTIGAVTASVVALLNLSGQLDAMVVSESELAAVLVEHTANPHPGAQQQIDALAKATKCQAIDIRISIIEQQIWQMEQVKDDSPRLTEKRRELKNLEAGWISLNCGGVV